MQTQTQQMMVIAAKVVGGPKYGYTEVRLMAAEHDPLIEEMTVRLHLGRKVQTRKVVTVTLEGLCEEDA